jgi:hypothetical protein
MRSRWPAPADDVLEPLHTGRLKAGPPRRAGRTADGTRYRWIGAKCRYGTQVRTLELKLGPVYTHYSSRPFTAGASACGADRGGLRHDSLVDARPGPPGRSSCLASGAPLSVL